VARILIVGGGCRGRQLAAHLVSEGNAVRISTRSEAVRAAIEAAGAECWIGTPDRLATLRAALDGVTIACWLLGAVTGEEDQVRALHESRLRFFLGQLIDTTVRGFIYEAAGTTVPATVLANGERIVAEVTERNVIPREFLTADPRDAGTWVAEARTAIRGLLHGASAPGPRARAALP
jgi:hypothetical protein